MKKSPRIPLIIAFLFITAASISIFTSSPDFGTKLTQIKSSNPLGYRIHIDNNWTDTVGNYSWCTGGGGNPYVIQDIEIDADGEYGILIENSIARFRIENVTIYNAGTPVANSSIVLYKVDNGLLFSNDLSDNSYCAVQMEECNNITLEYNTIVDNGNRGMNILECSYIRIRHNQFTNNGQYGINHYVSNLCEIKNNTFSGVGGQNYGYYFYDSDDCNFTDNLFFSHSSTGINSVSNLRTNITNNKFINNGRGIYGLQTHNGEINFNNFTSNYNYGVFFSACQNMWIERNRFIENGVGYYSYYNSKFNTFTENIFQDNIEYGISFYNDGTNLNTDHLFYKNSFISNPIHALNNAIDTDWNNTEYGNYWDNYTGVDPDLDGIGNTPYVVPPNITDYKPLMVANFSLLDDNDGDTISDYAELDGGLNTEYDNEPTNPYNPDSDGDGLDDYEEITGIGNGYNISEPTNPNNHDMDGDGYFDGEEATGSSNTYDNTPTNPKKMDSDGDGIDDPDEITLGFNPNDIWQYPKPDLIILSNYSLDGEVISFTIKNNGVWKATAVTVVVNISSISLTLFDNTLIGFDLEVNETKEIRILKADFRYDLVEGENYFLSIYVDPILTVNETSEANNAQESILYNHSLSPTGLTPLQLALIIVSSFIVVAAAIIASYILAKQRKDKREFKPMQLMVLERQGSTLLYTHKFSQEEKNGKKLDNSSHKKREEEEKETIEEPDKEIDEILAAGAFSGIQSLLKSILRTEKGINEISHGEYTIYFNYDEKVICVLIAYGKFHRILNSLKLFSTAFEETFQNEIKEFDGRIDVFFRAYQIVEKYFPK